MASRVRLAGEHKQRALVKNLVDSYLETEAAPMPFPLRSGEEITGVPFPYCPNLVQKVTCLLQQNKERLANINLSWTQFQ